MIRYSNLKDNFLAFNTVKELKEYLVDQWYGLVHFNTISFVPINDNWKEWRYVCVEMTSPWDGRPHYQTIGIAELGEEPCETE